MSKSNDIVIFENPQRGMAPHPNLGIGLIRGIDINTYPGIARLNKTTSKISGSTITNLVYWIKKDPNSTARYFALDGGGQLYVTTNSGSTWSTVAGETSGGSGQGMEIWKGYVVVARATAIDVYSIAGATWTNSFKTDLDATQDFHTMLTSVDDKLYICAGKYVASLTEVTTFDPASSATYTWTPRAITLPQFYNAKCLADLGDNLMVGCWKGITGAIYEKVADIIPYDRATLTLKIPIKIGENGVHAMLTVGNRLYVIAGINAKIFVTDGVSSAPVSEISNYAINLLDSGYRLDINPGAICYHRGKILFGVDNSGGVLGSNGVNGNSGVWSLEPLSKQLVMENTISTGNDGSSARLAIGALYSFDNESYWIGWKDFSGGTSSGIDSKSASSFIQSYGGFIETPFVQIGQALGKKTIQNIEFYLSKPLLTDQGIRIKYRTNLSDLFTLLATRDYATNGAIQTDNIPAATITNAVFIQLRIELTSGGSYSPELVRVVCIPSL